MVVLDACEPFLRIKTSKHVTAEYVEYALARNCTALPLFSCPLFGSCSPLLVRCRCLSEESRLERHFLPKHPQCSRTEEAQVGLTIIKNIESESSNRWLLIMQASFCTKHAVIPHRSLTYNLDVKHCCVHMVFNLHGHLVFARVATLCFTDEDDAVTVCVADANVRGLDGFAFLQPGDLRPRFALQTPLRVYCSAEKHVQHLSFWGGGALLYHEWHNKVDGLSNSAGVRLLQVSRDADLGWF